MDAPGSKDAAVLVPLYEQDGVWHAVFTERRHDLDQHAGEISFPGGAQDFPDEDLRVTALRESEEEIGIAVELASLRFLGNRRAVNESEAGIRDREIQAIYLHRDDRPLTAYRPSPYELDALIKLPLLPLLAYLAGETETLTADSIAPGAAESARIAVRRDDFVPTVDRYAYRVAIAASLALRGETHVAV